AASIDDPKAVVQSAAIRLTAQLTKQKENIEKDDTVVARLVENELMPIFDARLMSALVLNKNWKVASPDQKKEFTRLFSKILISTYSNAFSSYNGEELVFKEPIYNKLKNKAIVRSKILKESGMPILVDYRLRKKDTGWFVYDAVIEGVGLVNSYRREMKDKVAEKGLAVMLQELDEKT
ncbi:MAG: ABC transporter substrate-binding protein, partial [Gammaproteobacteria bacterium]|nr:ABC transporter substrate-binding protein [Gammaproteobacteria bacterium]